MRARTAAVNELKALVVTADDELRRELRGLRAPKLVARCTKFRDTPHRAIDQRCTRAAMKALAGRIEHLDHEVDDHYRVLQQLHGDRQAGAHFVDSFPRPAPPANTGA